MFSCLQIIAAAAAKRPVARFHVQHASPIRCNRCISCKGIHAKPLLPNECVHVYLGRCADKHKRAINKVASWCKIVLVDHALHMDEVQYSVVDGAFIWRCPERFFPGAKSAVLSWDSAALCGWLSVLVESKRMPEALCNPHVFIACIFPVGISPSARLFTRIQALRLAFS